jgi:hypothetical protein
LSSGAPPHIFLKALGVHIEDGGVIYTWLQDQDMDVFNEVLERYAIGEWIPAG